MSISYSLQGISVSYDETNTATSVQSASFAMVSPTGDAPTLTYSYLTDGASHTSIWLDGNPIIAALLDGAELSENVSFELAQITTAAGSTQILSLLDADTGTEYLFVVGGDPLSLPTDLAGYAAFQAAITLTARITSGALSPDTDFSITDFAGLTSTPGSVALGADGNDNLTGTAGHDLLSGGAGSDTLWGGAGNDELNAGANTGTSAGGGDQIHTGLGSDWVDYSDATSGFQTLTYAWDAQAIDAYLDAFDDVADVLQGDTLDVLIDIQTAFDTNGADEGGFGLTGTAHDDVFTVVTSANDRVVLNGGDGNDSYDLTGNGTVQLSFYGGTTGAGVSMTWGIIWDDGHDNWELFSGTVTEIRGTVHSDYFNGTSNDETFILEAGNDTLNAGYGTDLLRYDRDGITGGVDLDLVAGTASGTWDGLSFAHTLTGVDQVLGSDGDDTLAANAETSLLRGNAGADRFVLADGGILVIEDYQIGTDVLDMSSLALLTAADIADAFGNATDEATGAEILLGTGILTLEGITAAQASQLTYIGQEIINLDDSHVFDNEVTGDIYIGNAGNDTLTFSYVVNGFAGVEYSALDQAITVTLDGGTNIANVVKGTIGTDTLIGVATAMEAGVLYAETGGLGLLGSTHDDSFTLTAAAGQWMRVAGGAGNDSFILAGAGEIQLDYATSTSGITANLATGVISDGLGGTDTVSGSVDELRGSDFADAITGSAGADVFVLRAGNDTLNGASGEDLLRFDQDQVADLVVNLGANTASGTWDGTGFTHSISNIEQVLGTTGNDRLTGDSAANTLWGDEGQDTLAGGAGNDILIGGDTDTDLRDVLYGGDGNDSLSGGAGNDELRGDAGNDTLLGGDGNDSVIGGSGDDVLSGQALGDYMYGGDGTDFLNGGSGQDMLNGGAGGDRFYHQGVLDHGSDWVQDYTASEGDVLVYGGSAAASDFQVNLSETTGAGSAGTQEAFVIYRPTGQILWALVDGADQSSINLMIGGSTYDLLA